MVKENRDIEQDKKQILKIGLLTDEVFEKNYQQKCKENDELLWAVIALADDYFNIKNDYINKKEYALIRNRVSEDPLSFCYRYLLSSKNGIKAKLYKNFKVTSLKDIRNAATLSEDVYKIISSVLRQDPRKQGCDEEIMIQYLKTGFPFLSAQFPPKNGRGSKNIDSDGDIVSSYGAPIDTKSLDAILSYRIPNTTQTITFEASLKFIKAVDGGGAQDNQRNDLINHLKNSTKLSKNHYGLGLFAGEYFTEKRCSSISKTKGIDPNKAFSMHIKDFGTFCCNFIPKKVQEMCNIDDETKQYVSNYFSEIKVVYEDLAKTQQAFETNNIQLNATQTNNLW